MKKPLLLTMMCLLMSWSSIAQTTVQLNIHHKLGEAAFALETPATNNLDNDYKVTRLEYYISEISLIHDGGLQTPIEDLWILVDASEQTQVDLGDYNITSLEAIELHIGVDPDHNHLDPASYSSDHPLAPQFPSMHWGWASGYRFVAMEGFGSSSFNQLFELHGLGDNNYLTTVVPLELNAENGQIEVNLNADYEGALENINVNSGVIVHGSGQQAGQCLKNFRDYVFSSADISTSTVDHREVTRFTVFPNPSDNGRFSIALDATGAYHYDLSITDVLGQRLQYFSEVPGGTNLSTELTTQGLYFVNLIKEGQVVIVRKLIVK